MTKFEAGRTYWTRSICDSDCIFAFEILDRTDKSVLVNIYGKAKRRKLSVWDGVEQFSPFGRYSMSAIISADRVR